MFPLVNETEDETRESGERFSRRLEAGDVVALFGDLGTGKTQFVKGVCRGLGIEEALVSSPTFTIVHEYEGSLPVYHLDLYRVRKLDEALEFGMTEYLGTDGVCLIEWPEVVDELLPPGAMRLSFSHADNGARRIDRVDRAGQSTDQEIADSTG